MLNEPQLSAILKSLPTILFEGTLYRIIDAKHSASPLSAIGSTFDGGRYNPRRSFEALYLSFSETTAMAEVHGYSATAPDLTKMKGPPKMVLSVDCQIERVLDLCDLATQKQLGTNLTELLADWRFDHITHGINSVSQQLGIASFNLGTIQAIKVRSARDPKFDNIVIFPDRLVKGAPSFFEVFDPFGILPPTRWP